MTSLRTTCCCLLLIAAIAPCVEAGGGSFRKDVRYPTRFDTKVTTTRDGKAHVVVVPSDFKTRKTGTSLENTRVGVVQSVAREGADKPVYTLAFPDGPTLNVTTGSTLEADGERYLALGPQGEDYLLLDLRTRKRLRFTRPPARPPDSP